MYDVPTKIKNFLRFIFFFRIGFSIKFQLRKEMNIMNVSKGNNNIEFTSMLRYFKKTNIGK